MKNILAVVGHLVKKHVSDILLSIVVIIISLCSFAAGFLVAREQLKEPIHIESYGK